MKKLTVLVLAVLLLLMTGTGVSAKVQREPSDGTMTLDHYIDMGEWTYSGGNIHFRGMVEYLWAEARGPCRAPQVGTQWWRMATETLMDMGRCGAPIISVWMVWMDTGKARSQAWSTKME